MTIFLNLVPWISSQGQNLFAPPNIYNQINKIVIEDKLSIRFYAYRNDICIYLGQKHLQNFLGTVVDQNVNSVVGIHLPLLA